MVTLGYGPRTIWHGCTLKVWSNNSQDSMGTRARPVRASYGPRTEIFNVFHILRDPYGTRKGAVRQPYRHLRELTQPELAKLPHGRRIWPYGARRCPLRAPQGLFTGCLQSLNLYGARKLIMHALKLYGSRTGRQNSYGAARGPCGPREWTYDFCSKQPGNSPYGARECDVTEALGNEWVPGWINPLRPSDVYMRR